MESVIHLAKIYANTHSPVMIYGESGTGKELFAQSIHNQSQCHRGPFVAINCAAIPETLLESELFGYEGGSFTGARREGKEGLIELAHQGTLFLDEIGELPLPIQSRLLRVLQEYEIMRVGERTLSLSMCGLLVPLTDRWKNGGGRLVSRRPLLSVERLAANGASATGKRGRCPFSG